MDNNSAQQTKRIANRHVARCLTKIEEVHTLPEICSDVIRREMHYCANDVAEALQGDQERQHPMQTIDADDDNRGNR